MMIKRIDDTNDDQIRVLGKHNKPNPQNHGHKSFYIICITVILLLVTGGIILGINRICFNKTDQNDELKNALFEPETGPVMGSVIPLGSYYSDSVNAYTEHLEKTINDIPLDIYIPHNASPELCIGIPDISDESIILTAQAADFRADNGKIVGAFVLNGKPMAWGLSKKGYCAIIDGDITIGVADNSPKFEEATEKGGYFFRQYPLVDNGRIVENEPKGKAIRKAICDRAGEIFIVMTTGPESFHDFSQALVDLNIDNAIYLVGSQYSYGFYRDETGKVTEFSKYRRSRYKFENYIVWHK